MVEHILVSQQLYCNVKNKFVSHKSEIPPLATNKYHKLYASDKYLSFSSAQKIVHNLLNYDRVVLLPHIVPRFTESELAGKLNITIRQLRHLQKTPEFYNKIAKHICLPLTALYCSSKLREVRYE
ncbi:MAG: hypothetical protein WCH10_06945 [bacterium]